MLQSAKRLNVSEAVLAAETSCKKHVSAKLSHPGPQPNTGQGSRARYHPRQRQTGLRKTRRKYAPQVGGMPTANENKATPGAAQP
ncbi:hypothetical protein VTI74DRAFT_7222 [Chaetomium olivicolor]